MAVDEPEGDPSRGKEKLNSPKTYLHLSPYPEQHVRSYADTGSRLVAREARCRCRRVVGPLQQDDVVTAALGEHEPGSVRVDDVGEVAQPASAGSGRHV